MAPKRSVLGMKRTYVILFAASTAVMYLYLSANMNCELIPNSPRREGVASTAASASLATQSTDTTVPAPQTAALPTATLPSPAAVPLPPPAKSPAAPEAKKSASPAAGAPTQSAKAPKIEATTMDPSAYAPTGYPDTGKYPGAHLYPARVELQKDKIVAWDRIKLPEKLPIHGLRISNRQPQLGVILALDDVLVAPGAGTKFNFREYESTGDFEASDGIGADELLHTKFPQFYEPTAPYSIETGVMATAPGNCFMSMPKKGLKIYTATYQNGSKVSVAHLPMLGPYGNEPRFNCYNQNMMDAFKLRPTVVVNVRDTVGTPGRSGYLESYTAVPGGAATWDDGVVDEFVQASKNRHNNVGNYIDGHARLYNVFKHYSPKGKNCMVLGSAPNPWVEGILLDHGAAHVTTSEYQVPLIPKGSRWSSRMSTIHHEDLLANPVLFDMIVIFSSIEHDGLGRYTDPISPGGDLQQMRNLHDLLKPGGLLVVEVPLGVNYPDIYGDKYAQDFIQIPRARQYGPVRFPELAKPFKLLGMYQAWEGVVQVGEEPGIGGYHKRDTIIAQIKKQNADIKACPDGATTTGCSPHHGVSVLQRPLR